MRVALISDTHSYIDDNILSFCKEADEIWHAGDIGSIDVINAMNAVKPVRAVYGNIDAADIRFEVPETRLFTVEGLKVFMIHIGGYPGHYSRGIPAALNDCQPQLFICGHSHILRVMPDKSRNMLFMNPGACGHHGFHPIRTMLRFSIENGKILRPEAIELGKRGIF